MQMHHTSVYLARRRKPATSLSQAIDRLREMVKARAVDTKYPSRGTPETKRITNRIVGERE
jgi:hypothetical protein